jgi:tryptophan synthase alpha chain
VTVPVGVGFGIRDARTAQAVGSTADAVVIGTRILQLIGDQPRERVVPVVREFLGEIRQALDALPGATPKNAAGG